MPSMTTPSSGGTSENGYTDNGNGSSGPNGGAGYSLAGEIMLSRQETAALAALHFGADPKDKKGALERARQESGLSHQQVLRLQARANRARANGVTLKGPNLTLKPTALPKPGAPDEPGLLRDNVSGKPDSKGLDRTDKEAKTGARGGAAVKAPGVMGRGYSGRQVSAPEKKTATGKKQ